MRKILLSILSLFLLVTLTTRVNANKQVNVSVKASFTNNTKLTLISNNTVTYGSEINVTANKQEEESFAYWIVNGVVDLERKSTTTFIATNSLNAIAVYYRDNMFAVSFVDHSGELIETKYASLGTNVLEPDELPTKYGYVYNDPKWLLIHGNDNSFLNINENKVFKLRYKLEETDKVLINGEEYEYNSVVTITSTSNTFSHWEDEKGNVISFYNSFKVSALYDREIIEVSKSTPLDEKPLINASHNLKIRPGYISKLGQVYLPDGFLLIEVGYLVSKTSDELNINNATIVQAKSINKATNEFLISVNNEYTNIRGYLTYKDTEEEIHTIYSSLVESTVKTTTFEKESVGGNYEDKYFTDSNGVEWNLVHGRNYGDFGIDDGGIMLRRAKEPSSLEGIFGKGIGSFSFQYRNAHTGSKIRTYKVDITNNNVTTTFDLIPFGETNIEETDIYTFIYDGPKLNGETIIKIYAVGNDDNQQATFNNFKWTEFEVDIETVDTHIVNFETEGGTLVESQMIRDGKFALEPDVPLKTGKVFAGWYDEDNNLFDFNTHILKDITLFAKWENIEREEIVLVISDFGETNNTNNSYSREFDEDVINKVEGGTTNSWKHLGVNYNGTGWDYIRIGEKDKAGTYQNPNNYLSTNFKLKDVTKVEINLILVKSGTTIYLQSSVDKNNWTDVTSKTITSHGVIVFDDLDIAEAYYRILFVNASPGSTNGWLATLKSITFYGLEQIDEGDDGEYPELPEDLIVFDTGKFVGRDSLPAGWTKNKLGTDYAINSTNAEALKFDSTGASITSPEFSITSPVEVSIDVKSNAIIDSKLYIKDQGGNILHVFTDFTESPISFTLIDTSVNKLTIEYEKVSGNLGVGRVKVEYLLEGNPIFELYEDTYFVLKNSNWNAPELVANNFFGGKSFVTNDFDSSSLSQVGTHEIEYIAEDREGRTTYAYVTYYVINYEGELDGYPNMNESKLEGTYNSYENDRSKLTKKANADTFNPSVYYASLNNLSGKAFVDELKRILTVTQTSYGEARFVSEISDAIDTVWGTYLYGIYDDYKLERYWNGAAGYEREHVWPNSYLGQGSHPGNTVRNIQTDMHNIRAILGSTNSTRSNRYFVDGSGIGQTIGAGSYYPGDDHRGDVARILMYMHVRYNDVLVLTDNAQAISNYHYDNHSSTLLDGKIPFGLLSVLLRWHEEDEVSEFELYRNDVIYEYQGNRNPFIDNPDYVNIVFDVETSSGERVTISVTIINTDMNITDLYKGRKGFLM